VTQIFDDIFSKAGESPNGMRRKSLDPEEIDRRVQHDTIKAADRMHIVRTFAFSCLLVTSEPADGRPCRYKQAFSGEGAWTGPLVSSSASFVCIFTRICAGCRFPAA
jgi:hypothetical protein